MSKRWNSALQTGTLVSDDISDVHCSREGSGNPYCAGSIAGMWLAQYGLEIVFRKIYGYHSGTWLHIGLWTVDNQQDIRRFASTGVNSIIADRPDLFQSFDLPCMHNEGLASSLYSVKCSPKHPIPAGKVSVSILHPFYT